MVADFCSVHLHSVRLDIPRDERMEDLLGHRIRPTFTHTSSLSCLQASASSTTGQTIGDSVGHLVHDDIVL